MFKLCQYPTRSSFAGPPYGKVYPLAHEKRSARPAPPVDSLAPHDYASVVTPRLPRPRAVLLDMDGTLTCPMLDFDAIRAEMGITGPILEAMRKMTDAEQVLAQRILDRHESHAAEQSLLNDGCDELLAMLRTHDIRSALITRNSRTSVDVVLRKHGMSEHFDLLISRELSPTKPHPYPLLHACEQLGVDPCDAWMVGDGSHDIEAGVAAGIRTVWISHDTPRSFSAEPVHTVVSLRELIGLLRSTID